MTYPPPGRALLIAQLMRLNAEAQAITWKLSPAAEEKHAEIDEKLNQIIGR